MNQEYINALYCDLVRFKKRKTALEAKYPSNFGLHKTRLGSAQADKEELNRLHHTIFVFDQVLSYYGYEVNGPEHILIKVDQ